MSMQQVIKEDTIQENEKEPSEKRDKNLKKVTIKFLVYAISSQKPVFNEVSKIQKILHFPYS